MHGKTKPSTAPITALKFKCKLKSIKKLLPSCQEGIIMKIGQCWTKK
jgi:hypothetical protein